MSDLTQHYFELIKSKLPLWRLLILILGATYPYLASESNYHSTVLSTLETKIFYLLNSESELIKNISLRDITVGIFFAFFCYLSTLLITKGLHTVAFKSAQDYIKTIEESQHQIENMKITISERIEFSNNILRKVEPYTNSIRNLSQLSELFVALATLCFISFKTGNILDLILGLAFIVASIYICFHTTTIFIEKCYPSIIVSEQLLKKNINHAQI